MLKTEDPNDVRNYSPEDIAKALPVQEPTIKEDNTTPDHPTVEVVRRLVGGYPYLEVWTTMYDRLAGSVEIRIKLFKTEAGSKEFSKPNSRK